MAVKKKIILIRNYFFVPGYRTTIKLCCVAHLNALFIIERSMPNLVQEVQVSDTTKTP
ncbi:hypothetical protein BH11BAC6_BH11BAC6_18350 [soil metagenome]